MLLYKEFGMHILLNTHSPYLLDAIEVYALKHTVESSIRPLSDNSFLSASSSPKKDVNPIKGFSASALS